MVALLLGFLAYQARSLILLAPYASQPFFTGFPVNNVPDGQAGPMACVWNQGLFYVTSSADGYIYTCGAAGGPANTGSYLGGAYAQPIAGVSGLDFTRDGHLYATQMAAGTLLELDPNTGTVLTTVLSGLSCPSQVVEDAASSSNDLLVSSICSNTIYQIANPAASPIKSVFSTSVVGPDGMAVATNGEVYVAGVGGVSVLNGTQSSAPGQLSQQISTTADANGVALVYGRPGLQPYLFYSRSDGTITRLDLNQNPATAVDLVEGGARGEGMGLDAQGCLYAIQGASVLKVSQGNGAGLSGPQPTPTPGQEQSPTPTPTAPPYQPAAPLALAPDLQYMSGDESLDVACFFVTVKFLKF